MSTLHDSHEALDVSSADNLVSRIASMFDALIQERDEERDEVKRLKGIVNKLAAEQRSLYDQLRSVRTLELEKHNALCEALDEAKRLRSELVQGHEALTHVRQELDLTRNLLAAIDEKEGDTLTHVRKERDTLRELVTKLKDSSLTDAATMRRLRSELEDTKREAAEIIDAHFSEAKALRENAAQCAYHLLINDALGEVGNEELQRYTITSLLGAIAVCESNILQGPTLKK